MKGWAFAVLTACAVVACGGGSGSGSGSGGTATPGGAGTCGAAQACGGSLIGTWTGVAECTVSPAVQSDGQCTQTISESTTDVSYTAVFNSDTTYTLSTGSFAQDFTLTSSAACLTEGGAADTCSDLSAGLTGNGFDTATCTTASGGGCSCALTETQDASNDSGTFMTTNDALVLNSTANGAESATYCVSGTTLHVLIADSSSGTLITEDLVFVKQ